MDRSEALNTLRREYQSDYQKEIKAARDLANAGVRLVQGTEGGINLADKVTFVSLGQARKRFVDAVGPAIKPVLEIYARELEREAASLGLDGQITGDQPLMESLHDVLRHLQMGDLHSSHGASGQGGHHTSHPGGRSPSNNYRETA